MLYEIVARHALKKNINFRFSSGASKASEAIKFKPLYSFTRHVLKKHKVFVINIFLILFEKEININQIDLRHRVPLRPPIIRDITETERILGPRD